jgi:Tol biopolymer transport system component
MLLFIFVFVTGVYAEQGDTERVSVSSEGVQGDDYSSQPSISSDGRYVAFRSYATNLVESDTDGYVDIFVHDRQTGETTRVSVSSEGTQGDDYSYKPSISSDGRYVAFSSEAFNLVENDTNNNEDVFVHDRQTGETTRVSVSSEGTQGSMHSESPSISSDGRYVAFYSWATNLVENDTNNNEDVFVHDRQTGETTRVSVSSEGTQGDDYSYNPSISSDGRYVAFYSWATNLVESDTNGRYDVFVHDRQTGETTRVSVSSTGIESDGSSYNPSISSDGRYVAFYSRATNLVESDTNGCKDVFVHDRQTGETTRASVSSEGTQGSMRSESPSISSDGRYVAFDSFATNLVESDTNDRPDVFVHDRQTGETTRVNVSSTGIESDGYSYETSISSDGRYVAFYSRATNLVENDTNGCGDVFVHEYLGEISPEEQIDEVIESFDEWVEDGSVEGSGQGNSAAGRLNAFGNMLDEAEALIDAGLYEEACEQLMAAYMKTDGLTPPPDFVTGEQADDLAAMIQDLMDNLGCE